ncbi:Host attachment protein [Sphingomonas changnyeongensis]|uniref:Host attachment protein n=1 Tax=Sphingomonas changnyeongensis TaxID=2698679 RepID=A0A7Z2NUA1_9SPHN|nr:host attachment family protein [Sphingomonas changnyeongensis]QHL89561.1 Host attachment protein [Sphingomonas changnyeongensis]
MRIPHDTLVLVADGSRMLLFRNAGSPFEPELELLTAAEQDNPRTAAQGTDAPGRGFASAGAPMPGVPGRQGGAARRSAYANTDFHNLEEARFAADAAAMLNARAEAGRLDRLVVIAPARTLGELRDHYGRAVADRLIGEVAKDLTNHPVDRIAAILADA